MEKAFSTQDAMRVGWQRLLANQGPLLLAFVLTFGLTFGLGMVSDRIFGENDWRSLLITWPLNAIISLLIGFFLLRAYDEGHVGVGDMFKGLTGRQFWTFIVANTLFVLMVCVGMVLFIVPGIYLGMRYSMFGYLIMDRPEIGAIDSLKQSAELTRGHMGELFLFFLAVLGLNLLGLLAFVVGLIATVIVTGIASVHVYRKLVEAKATGSAVAAPLP